MNDDHRHEDGGPPRGGPEGTPDDVPRDEITNLLRTHFRAPDIETYGVKERIRASVRAEERDVAFRRRGSKQPKKERWRTSWPFRVAAAVAASLVIFVGGAEYGRRAATSTADVSPATQQPAATLAGDVSQPSLGLPISIQEAGSNYVSRLATLTARSSSLAEGERRMAEEVAWASLRGAATELARVSEDSEALANLILELERAREGEVDLPPNVISF